MADRIAEIVAAMDDEQLDGLIRMVLMQQNPLADPMYSSYNKNMASSTFVKSAQSNVDKQMGLFRDRDEKMRFVIRNAEVLAKYDNRFKGVVGPTMTQPIRQAYDDEQTIARARQSAQSRYDQEDQSRSAMGLPPVTRPGALDSGDYGSLVLPGGSVPPTANTGGSVAPTTSRTSPLAGLAGLDTSAALQRAYAMQRELMANGTYLVQTDDGKWQLSPEAANLEAYISSLTSQGELFHSFGGNGGAADHFAENMAWEKEKWAQQMEMQKAEERRAIMQAKAQIAMQAAGLMGDQYGNALRTQAQLAPDSLVPGQQYYMGYEPGGVAQSLYSMAGLPYAPRQAVGVPVDTMQGVNAMAGVVGQLQGILNGLG